MVFILHLHIHVSETEAAACIWIRNSTWMPWIACNTGDSDVACAWGNNIPCINSLLKIGEQSSLWTCSRRTYAHQRACTHPLRLACIHMHISNTCCINVCSLLQEKDRLFQWGGTTWYESTPRVVGLTGSEYQEKQLFGSVGASCCLCRLRKRPKYAISWQ